MNNVWVVVASSTRCRIFTQRTHNGALLLLDELNHPEGRLHSRDLNSDRPGRSFDSHGEGRHAMGEPVDPVEQENLRFAKTVATLLEDARKKTQFDRLVAHRRSAVSRLPAPGTVKHHAPPASAPSSRRTWRRRTRKSSARPCPTGFEGAL
jgi:hypothetical protein